MLFCSFCKQPREANTAPCPTCGAPSPLQDNAFNFQGAHAAGTSWDETPTSTNIWDNANASDFANQQLSFPDQNNPWSPSPDNYEQGQSLVTYQGGQPQNLMVMPQGQRGNDGAVVPYETPMPDEGPMYVPPMYTKPRPIISRRRAISGLISVIVVTILLCGGVTYAAKATGKLGFVNNIFGDSRPASIQPPAAPNIPNPRVLQETGPANAIIFSATTASSITRGSVPIQPEHVFKPGQTVYLTYTVHPKGKGKVTIKWYTNNQLFRSYSSDPITDIVNSDTHASFPRAIPGKVELYWNDQLAIRLYFVVR